MTPDNVVALRQILAGERAMEQLYLELERTLEGEAAFLASLLYRDWSRHFLDIMAAGDSILRQLDAGNGEAKSLPSRDPFPLVESLS